jgi:hypothetical protein
VKMVEGPVAKYCFNAVTINSVRRRIYPITGA